jgi:DNA polymerase III subunit alpha
MTSCPIKSYGSFHNHSHYSIMDAIPTPEEMVIAAKQRGLKRIALTDHGVCHGHADLYFASKKHGMPVAYGMEGYLIHDLEDWRRQKEEIDATKKKGKKKKKEGEGGESASEDDLDPALAKALKGKGHLVLVATSSEGLSNLYRLSYLAHRDGFYQKPRADKRLLADHVRGLIASTACMGGVISRKCWQWKDGKINWSEVIREAEEYDRIFGRGRFFLELQLNDDPGQVFINDCMVRIHRETGIPLTVTTDSHYVNPDDRAAQDFLYMLRSDKTLATRGERWTGPSHGLWVKDSEQVWESFLRNGKNIDPSLMQAAFENTLLIDSLIEDFEPDTSVKLPSLPIENPTKELAQRAVAAMVARGLDKDERYFNRLFHELKVIRDKGFANYFLITQKIVETAKQRMLVGPGRGCFVSNTRVLMSDGLYCPIEIIRPGDVVKDAVGDDRVVVDVLRYEVDEELIELEFEDGKRIICTMDHLFLTSNRGWVAASELTEEDEIVEVLKAPSSARYYLEHERETWGETENSPYRRTEK